tara:strand:+ start:224 stop:418 length:195 start_codon:yes stop_codon:yes gene_type:complete
MKSSTVLKELLALKEAYRKQNFTYTTDQQARYKELLAIRRQFVSQWYKDGKVWVGPSNIKSTRS